MAARGARAAASSDETYRILHALAENDPEINVRIAALRQGLETQGWAENRNVQIEHRYSAGDFAQMQANVKEIVRSAPDVIVASGSPVVALLKQATSAIRSSLMS